MRKQPSAIEQALQKKRAGGSFAKNNAGFAASEPRQAPYDENRPTEDPAGMAVQPDETGFEDVRDELMQLIREGRLPEDFDLQQACADPAFAQLIAEFPAEAAIRIYAAEKRAEEAESAAMQRVSTQVRSRNALPRSARGGAMSAPTPNYRDMDSATFRKMLADVKKTTRNGGRVRL